MQDVKRGKPNEEEKKDRVRWKKGDEARKEMNGTEMKTDTGEEEGRVREFY